MPKGNQGVFGECTRQKLNLQCSKSPYTRLVRTGGGKTLLAAAALERSLFENVYVHEFNNLEKNTAWYLDESQCVY